MSWFSGPMYRRYWQHYQQAMAWHQRHKRAYRKALEAARGPGHHRERRYADWQEGEDDGESSSGSEIECDTSNMEISEELRQYFAQTERHREELSKEGRRGALFSPSLSPAASHRCFVFFLSPSFFQESSRRKRSSRAATCRPTGTCAAAVAPPHG